ncbi:MAG: UTP--glucose-1-phosphate uridylyltransferase [Spirochaetes bacterium]|nr:UTP--glucose-1-phosphate uridylyltransferase [Spirochaetota bacterium]
MSIKARNPQENKIITKIKESGNEQVFYFWDQLKNEEKDQFIQQLAAIDLEQVNEYFQQFKNEEIVAGDSEKLIEPAPYFSLADRKSKAGVKELGLKALKGNKVAFLTVAGGQASRLGYEYPKGCYPISPLKKKSLFQIFAEKVVFYSQYYQVPFYWYVMTSESNNSATVNFFKENNYWGLKSEQVVFFNQGMLPTVTLEGKLILKEQGQLFRNPDGHGGILRALMTTKIIDDMIDKKIDYLSYFQVDNPLINMADPFFIGMHVEQKSHVSTKVIEKEFHNEKLGNIVLVDKVGQIIEYSDISEELTLQKKSDGSLKFNMGSIGIHIFNVDFLKEFTNRLPIHFARKKVKGYDFKQNPPTIDQLEAVKFERFVFDIIPLTKQSAFFETQRGEEFFPLKNKTGVDSIETCSNGQITMYRDWLKDAGFKLPETSVCEVSPLFAADRDIFLEKIGKNVDILKKYLFDESGSYKNEIYIE